MLWYEMSGKDSDVVVSSRIRLARNLTDYPFPGKLDEASAKEIIEKVKEAFEDNSDYTFTDFASVDNIHRLSEAEKHKISPEFASNKTPCALIESDKKQIYIMVLEEDHLRIQSIMSGFSLDEAYGAACEADDLIDSKLKVAYDEKLGYLTHCPTNLGTGMRASVMMFLPALTYARGIRSLQNQLGKIGLTIRGMSGEGSSADGCLYQISNQVTLGTSEKEIIAKLTEICDKIIEQERALRETLKKDPDGRFTDRIMRSYGTILYATVMDTAEMMKLYADVRLGSVLGIIQGVSPQAIDAMLIHGMPATLMCNVGSDIGTHERDRARPEAMRRMLGGVGIKSKK